MDAWPLKKVKLSESFKLWLKPLWTNILLLNESAFNQMGVFQTFVLINQSCSPRLALIYLTQLCGNTTYTSCNGFNKLSAHKRKKKKKLPLSPKLIHVHFSLFFFHYSTIPVTSFKSTAVRHAFTLSSWSWKRRKKICQHCLDDKDVLNTAIEANFNVFS